MWPFKDKSIMQKMTTTKQGSVEELNQLVGRLEDIQAKSKPQKVAQKIEIKDINLTKLKKLLEAKHDKTADDFFEKYSVSFPYNPLTHDKSGWDFYKELDFSGHGQYKRNKKLYMKYHAQIYHIEMKLKNGDKILFWINEFEDGFTYNNQQYVFDNGDALYHVIDSLGNKWPSYDYYEGMPLPIKHELPVNDIRAAIEEGKTGEEVAEVAFIFNPILLLKWVISDIIKKLFAKDEDKSDWTFWIVCGIAVFMLLTFAFTIYNSIKLGHTSKVVDFLQNQLNNLVSILSNLSKR